MDRDPPPSETVPGAAPTAYFVDAIPRGYLRPPRIARTLLMHPRQSAQTRPRRPASRSVIKLPQVSYVPSGRHGVARLPAGLLRAGDDCRPHRRGLLAVRAHGREPLLHLGGRGFHLLSSGSSWVWFTATYRTGWPGARCAVRSSARPPYSARGDSYAALLPVSETLGLHWAQGLDLRDPAAFLVSRAHPSSHLLPGRHPPAVRALCCWFAAGADPARARARRAWCSASSGGVGGVPILSRAGRRALADRGELSVPSPPPGRSYSSRGWCWIGWTIAAWRYVWPGCPPARADRLWAGLGGACGQLPADQRLGRFLLDDPEPVQDVLVFLVVALFGKGDLRPGRIIASSWCSLLLSARGRFWGCGIERWGGCCCRSGRTRSTPTRFTSFACCSSVFCCAARARRALLKAVYAAFQLGLSGVSGWRFGCGYFIPRGRTLARLDCQFAPLATWHYLLILPLAPRPRCPAGAQSGRATPVIPTARAFGTPGAALGQAQFPRTADRAPSDGRRGQHRTAR